MQEFCWKNSEYSPKKDLSFPLYFCMLSKGTHFDSPGERKICREDKGRNEDEEAMDMALLALCFVLSLAPYALAVGNRWEVQSQAYFMSQNQEVMIRTEPVRKTQQRWIMQQR